MTSGKDFFESEEDYRARMSKQADKWTIERVTGEAPEKNLFEGKEEFRDRLGKEAKESAIEGVTGEKPGKGFLESEGDYRKRIAKEANERTIEGIVGEEPSKGFFESEGDYTARIDREAKERIIEEATGSKPSKKFLESEDDYQKRISHRANEARANQGGENIVPKSIKDFLGWAAIVFFVLVYSYKAGKWIQEKIDVMWVNAARSLLARINNDGKPQAPNWKRTFLTSFIASPGYRKGIYVGGTLIIAFAILGAVSIMEKINPILRARGWL